ncbi:alanine racemase [Streptomyces spiramenti]|uniref:Amino acid deaminase n=1 Tax=Streptomyces spiramenti TaxID=2720606 RepID=A0ABX1ATR3_9ACTN|nr:alanine racemase [Streptomyces spiramenti]NJP68833.1 amino acid deaminase [Streptomyces spiramenti]
MASAIDRLADEIVDHRFRGLPPDADGRTVGALARERRDLYSGGFTTPVLTLSAEALEHNMRALGEFAERHGLAFAPHGKTSMAPALFRRQLDHGAWGITVAVPHQARVARAFGVQRIFLANEVVDAPALAWLAGELAADPEFRCVVYADSVRGVDLMDHALRATGATRPLEVVVELGARGGRTGARGATEAASVAAAVNASPVLALVGVAGYEGEVPDADEANVRSWLRELVALAVALDSDDLFAATGEIIVSAGGSAWFDAVAEVFAELPELSRPVLGLLRSGAYVSHDDGRYREVTPFNRLPDEGSLLPAFRLWAQVVSRPEPGLALVNAGKRDVAYDLGLPEVQVLRRATGGVVPARGLTVTRLSDQHAFVRGEDADDVPDVGDWVGLGMSHPCTIFDKWQLIPVVDADGSVGDFVRTFF